MTDKIPCPACGCTQVTANRRGFSGGAALAGDIVAGPIGLLAGTAGQNRVVVTCLGCGFHWPAGKQAQAGRALARRRFVGWVMRCVGKGFLWLLLGTTVLMGLLAAMGVQ